VELICCENDLTVDTIWFTFIE